MRATLRLRVCCAAVCFTSLAIAGFLQASGADTVAAQESTGQLPAPTQAHQQAPVQAPIQAPAKTAPAMTTMTIMVPQVSYKTVTVPDVICKPEVRQQTINVCRLVPETKTITCNTTVMVPERRTGMQTYNVCRMTFESVTTPVTVMVPRTEVRQGTRTVCKPVAVQQTQTVCKDMGGWQTKSYVDCYGCTQTCQVWAPNIVTEQVPVTVYKPQFVEEQFNYTAVVCQPETRNITRQIPKPVVETKTQEVSYVVPVPKQVQRQIPQTTYRTVTEQREINVTVMVPTRVERQVTVPVCEMVAKQVSVPACGTCLP